MIVLAIALAAAPLPSITLEADGLALPGGKYVRFGITREQAVAQIVAVLGQPLRRGTYPDCGQGIPMGHVHFRGDLEVSSIAGRFVGWTVDPPGGTKWRSAKGVGLGSTLAELKRAYPDTDTVDDSDMGGGIKFVSERGLSGFLEGQGQRARAVSLNAGSTCIVD